MDLRVFIFTLLYHAAGFRSIHFHPPVSCSWFEEAFSQLEDVFKEKLEEAKDEFEGFTEKLKDGFEEAKETMQDVLAKAKVEHGQVRGIICKGMLNAT